MRLINSNHIKYYLKHLATVLLLSTISFVSHAQTDHRSKVGEWETYFAYNQVSQLVETPDRIVGATRLGLIIIEKSDHSVRTLSKVNGLSDYFISAIGYNSYDQSILIGYENGNIDLLRKDRIDNVNDLKIKQLDSNKTINHFLPFEDRVLIATNFGIMVLNPASKEILSTYYIGDNASDLKINKLAIDNDYIYAATASGIRRVLKNAANIHVYEAWELFSPDQNEYSSILNFAGGIVASMGAKGGTNTLYRFDEGMATSVGSLPGFYNLSPASDKMLVALNSGIRIYNSSLDSFVSYGKPKIADVDESAAYRDALLSGDGELWAAHNLMGILNNRGAANWDRYLPNGPYSNRANSIKFVNETLLLVPGGVNSAWDNLSIAPSISFLSNTGWKHLTATSSPLLSGSRDLLSIIPNPNNPDNVFISSWGSGVFELDSVQSRPSVIHNHFTSNDGFQNIFPNDSRYVRVAAGVFDKNNTLWLPNSSVQHGLVAYFPSDQSWKRYSYNAINNVFTLTHFLATSNGDIWSAVVRAGGQSSTGFTTSTLGLFIWNDNGTPKDESDDRYKSVVPKAYDNDKRNQGHIELWDEEGAVISNRISALVEDQKGYIWIGTDDGIVVQYQPQTILSREKPVFSKIKIARNDGTLTADYLLDKKMITSIVVDPANRKWIGTEGFGVYLVSDDGSRQVEAFTSENSPLPSDYINAITIDERSGRVFIATGEGLVSFKGSAIKGSKDYSEMYAFPNPVRPEYRGNITITGLVAGTTVKITDVAGRLVHETVSVGGQAFWDGRNLWGDEVKTGVYLVFVANDDGSVSGVTKIAVVR